jgi:hypothetical protein
MEDVMANAKTPGKKAATATEKSAPAKKAAPVKRTVPAKKAAAPVKPKTRAAKQPVVGVLCDRDGELGICIGKDFYSLSLLADQGEAQLTLKVKLRKTKLARADQSAVLRGLTALLEKFLNQRALGQVDAEATCTNTSCKSGDNTGDGKS